MEKTIEELEMELEELKKTHRSLWDIYGSELCAGDMIRQEDELSKKILKLKIIKKWEEAGLSDGLGNPIPSKPATIEDPSQIVDD